AERTETPYYRLFGMKRTTDYIPFRNERLFLGRQYRSYGNQLIERITKLIEAKGGSPFLHTAPLEIVDTALDRRTSLSVEIFQRASRQDRGLNTARLLPPEFANYIDQEKLEGFQHPEKFLPFFKGGSFHDLRAFLLEKKSDCQKELYQRWKAFKKDHPAIYQTTKTAEFLKEVEETFPPPGSPSTPESAWKSIIVQNLSGKRTHDVIVTLRHQVAGKMYALGQYVTWADYTKGEALEETLEKMCTHSIALMCFQDIYLVDETLAQCQEIFKKAMQWSSSLPSEDLKNRVAPLIYILAYNHRDCRGTASETEWLERAIYQAHHLSIRSAPDRAPDLDALTNPLFSDFLRVYKDSFELVPY
ncbi:MAG: hypothetical protein WCN87_02135, partial [Chlamydiota bacterium]